MVYDVLPKYKPQRCDFDDNFARYYREVGRTKILDAKTERKLFQQYRRRKDLVARDRIIEGCLRFVIKLAHRYSSDINTLKDLIAAGNEGLFFALDRYDPERNTRFLSYAAHYVLLYIRSEIHNTELVTMPLWRQKTIRKVRRAKNKAAASSGCEPEADEICSDVNISLAQLERLQVEKFYYTSIEVPSLSTSTNGNGNDARTTTINEQAKGKLRELLLGLGPKERFVLRSYFGLVSDPMSLRQIAAVLGVSPERVRQIKVDALEKLRRSMSQKLDIKGVDAMFSV